MSLRVCWVEGGGLDGEGSCSNFPLNTAFLRLFCKSMFEIRFSPLSSLSILASSLIFGRDAVGKASA